MKVYEEPFNLKLPKTKGRSRGVHLSQILRDLAFSRKVLDRKWDVSIEESDTTLMQAGLAWENFLAAYHHRDIEFHPKELYLDGIYMSPDGLSCCLDDDLASTMQIEMFSWILHEFKLTLKSSRDFATKLKLKSPKVLQYLWQVMSYRYGYNILNNETCNVAKLHVLFVKGDYNKDTEADKLATYKIFRLHFRQEELEENWEMILNHKGEMKRHGRLHPE